MADMISLLLIDMYIISMKQENFSELSVILVWRFWEEKICFLLVFKDK